MPVNQIRGRAELGGTVDDQLRRSFCPQTNEQHTSYPDIMILFSRKLFFVLRCDTLRCSPGLVQISKAYWCEILLESRWVELMKAAWIFGLILVT